MAGPLVYAVCDQADIDPATNACAHVQYVQAPMLLPPLDAQLGAEIAMAIIGVWALAAVLRSL